MKFARNHHILRFLLGSVFLFATAAPGHAADSKSGPNILWLIVEDFGPHLGCYGTKEVWTPDLDKLAAAGVRYTRAFTTALVCSPSRLHPLRPRPIRETGASGREKQFQ